MVNEAGPGVEIARGAEAVLYRVRDPVLGVDVLRKVRVPKSYRHPRLDQELRVRRTRSEARLLHQAKAAGVRVPFVFDVDLKECSITMEFIEGQRLRDVLDADLAREVGRMAGRLHRAGLVHGDLTTSNMLLSPDGGIVFIDLGLGEVNEELEAKGVDMNVLAENVKAIHTGVDMDLVIEGYRQEHDIPIKEKIEDIRSRGRYLRRGE